MNIIENPNIVVPWVFAALAFLTVVALGLPWLQPDLFASRLKLIREQRDALSLLRRQGLAGQRPTLRRLSGRINFMRAVLERANMKTLIEQPGLKQRLVQAGWRGQAPLVTFTFLRLILPLAGLAFAMLMAYSMGFSLRTALGAGICLCGAAAGYYLPNVVLTNAITRRQLDIQRSFPDALDLMLICVEAGLSLEAAFSRVADELGPEARAMGEETAITTAELAFLSDRKKALENLAERAGTRSMRSLVTSLVQSEKYGTPLGAALRVVAQESRDYRMAKAEEKAGSLPAKLTVPMVTFFLPVLFLVLIGPTVIQVIKVFAHG
jgi:tight adherence protein C